MTLIAKWIRRATSLLAESEKTPQKADEFSLEHVLLYHGLTGSNPHDDRQFKDVRADFLSAVERQNPLSLSLSLKIQPLAWEDKLQRIAQEAHKAYGTKLMRTLVPVVDENTERNRFDPLMHEDWRVRANAALILAQLGTEIVVPAEEQLGVGNAQSRLIEALHDTAGSTSPAFPHVARALSTLRSAEAKAALSKLATHGEPWLRVDTLSALSQWPLDEIEEIIALSFEDHHDFLDYQAVVVSRIHPPRSIIKRKEKPANLDTAAALVVGLVEASGSTFSSSPQIFSEYGLHQTLRPMSDICSQSDDALHWRALHKLVHWLEATDSDDVDWPSPEELKAARELLESARADGKLARAISQTLAAAMPAGQTLKQAAAQPDETEQKTSKGRAASKTRHAIKLAGDLEISAVREDLLNLLQNDPHFRDEIIEALGSFGSADDAALLVETANKLVDTTRRSDLPPSPSPVVEADAEAARTYWYILNALGNMKSSQSLEFLLTALNDHAADKREAALNSAVKLYNATEGQLAKSNQVKDAVIKALGDPAVAVKQKAVEAAAQMNLAQAAPAVAKLTAAAESSLWRASYETLQTLADNGHRHEVLGALADARKNERNAAKSKRLDDFIERLRRS